jgi:hypothetical protein
VLSTYPNPTQAWRHDHRLSTISISPPYGVHKGDTFVMGPEGLKVHVLAASQGGTKSGKYIKFWKVHIHRVLSRALTFQNFKC